MPTMRFTNLEETKTIYFDSSPSTAIASVLSINGNVFSLRNERENKSGGRTLWDVYSIGAREDPEKTPPRKFGVLEYQPPEWKGGPSKPWFQR